jgi:hypothetical protein
MRSSARTRSIRPCFTPGFSEARRSRATYAAQERAALMIAAALDGG